MLHDIGTFQCANNMPSFFIQYQLSLTHTDIGPSWYKLEKRTASLLKVVDLLEVGCDVLLTFVSTYKSFLSLHTQYIGAIYLLSRDGRPKYLSTITCLTINGSGAIVLCCVLVLAGIY